ncbi:MAG: class I SAM-dependent methyltransferase [Bacteroidales bacterium]|nr:class I SAM-dependent methyltransferase [Bacteroidales bacterium]
MAKKSNLLNKVAYANKLFMSTRKFCYVPPGHYYSPIVDTDEIKKREKDIWTNNKEVKGVDLNVDEQKALLKEFEQYYSDLPFQDNISDKLRYYYINTYYTYTDGIMLYSMLRHFTPNHVVEVGSGFSSAIMLDVKDTFGLKTKLSFIEPYPDRLYSLLSEKDKKENEVLVQDIQSMPLEFFNKLEKNDMLFIDTTHICKTDSDVNYLFFEILPVLKKGVLIHIHDVFSGFEYPKDWVYEGRSWNEDYLLKAFLMYNTSFRIKLFSHFMHTHHSDVFKNMPLCYKNTGGNIWLEKL